MATKKNNNIKKTILMLLALLWLPVAAQTSWNMVNGGIVDINACDGAMGVIYDDGGPMGNYSDNFDGMVVITANPGATITLSGDYTLEGCCDMISVWDGNSTTGTLLVNEVYGNGTLNATATSGQMTLRFHSDGSVNYSGFAFAINFTGISSSCTHYADNLTVSGITTTQATLSWTGNGGSYGVLVDGHPYGTPSTSTTHTLTDLTPNMQHNLWVYPVGYDTYCCSARGRFHTSCGTSLLPFSEDFNDCTLGEMPECWTLSSNFDDEDTRPQVVEGGSWNNFNYSQRGALMVSCGDNSTSGHFGMAISPKINDGNIWRVSFKLRPSHWNTCLVLGICDSTSSEYNNFGFVPMDTVWLYDEGNWIDYVDTWTVPTGGCRLAFRMIRNMQDDDMRMSYIDDVKVEKCGIANASIFRTDSTSTMVEFTTFGGASVSIGVHPINKLADSITIDNITSSPVLISGLTPNTRYTVNIYTHCNGRWGLSQTLNVRTTAGPEYVTHYCFDNQNLEALTFINANNISPNGNAGINMSHYQGEKAYMVTNELGGLAGKEVSLRVSGYYSHITVGTMSYADDTSTFTPLASDYTDYYFTRYIKSTIPSTSTDHFIAVRFTSEITIQSLEAGTCLLDSLRITHRRGTSVVLGWKQEGGANDTVIVEYGPEGFTQGTGTEVTFVGQRRGTISGLSPNTYYDFIVGRPCMGAVCGNSRLQAWTRDRDYPYPLCEDFEQINWEDNGWHPIDGIINYPLLADEYILYRYNRTIELASAGYNGWWLSGLEIPDLEIDTGSILSFYASNYAPDGRLLVGYRMNNNMDFAAIDTIFLQQNNGERIHYNYTLPDIDNVFDNRLILRYQHTDEGHVYRCFIDEMQISHSSYNEFHSIYTGFDSVSVQFNTLGNATTVEVMLVSYDGSDTLSRVVAAGDSIIVGFGGLDTGSYYYCYITPLTGGCPSLAGLLVTPGIGGGEIPCYPFDNLLSYELPANWSFADNAMVSDGVLIFDSLAVLPMLGNLNGLHLTMRGAGDTLFIGYTSDLTLSSTSTVVITDTLRLTPQFHDTIFTLIHIPDGARLCLLGSDTISLDMVGLTGCPIVDFSSDGATLVCTLREGGSANYMVFATDTLTGMESRFHATSSPFRINTLHPGSTYSITYDCMSGMLDCTTSTLVTLTDSIHLPYCETFLVEDGSTGVPDNWTLISNREDIHLHVDLGWSETPLVLDGSEDYQYIVLPPIAHSGFTTVRTHAHIWDYVGYEIGTVSSTLDTSTFISLGHTEGSGWINLDVSIDSLGDRRIALRHHQGTCYLDRISISTLPLIDISLIDSRTLVLTANHEGSYYVRYRNDWGMDTVLFVDTTVYRIQTEEDINDIYVTPMLDSVNFFCGEENPRFQLNERMSLPFCKKDGWWDWYLRQLYREHSTGEVYENENYSFVFHTCPHPLVQEYLLMPDMDVDSVQELSMSFRIRSAYYYDLLEVGVMTNAYDTNTFVAVDSILYDDDMRKWHSYQLDFRNYHGNGRWIAFRHRGGGCTSCNDNTYLYLDDIYINNCPAGSAKAILSRYNIVEISSGEGTLNEDYFVEYGLTGFAQGEGTVVRISANPTLLTLTPERDYDFYFRCDSTDVSCQSPQQVHTLASPLVPPICISFEEVPSGALPPSWQQPLNSSQHSAVSELQSHSGTKSLIVGERVITPDIFVDSLQQISIGLWVRSENAGDRLVVGSMSDPNEPLTFTRMITISPERTGVWEHYYVSFRTAPANAHFIGLRHTNTSSTTLQNTLFVDDISLNTCGAFDMKITKVEDGLVTLNWNQLGSPSISITVLEDGTTPVGTYTPTAPPLDITNIVPQHSYTFLFHSSCSSGITSCDIDIYDTATIIAPKPGAGCVNPTDLASPNSIFFSGTFANPYSKEGAIDFGSRNSDSRHTVCYDTTERDPRTGGMLRMVPEGSTSSVRLGNWNTNYYRPEAEGVTYSLFVDTLSFNLLIMRYAAVLQDPMHAPIDQPRFRLELLDSSFNLIDSVCAAADFIADRSLGWNEAPDNVLWKDWTTFGIDLSAYADQQVYIRLTTYDCNEGSHYGYAYFNLECMRRTMTTEGCGDVTSNTFTAPAGFNYRWYLDDSPSTTISTDQILTISTANITYHCDITSLENSSCAFSLSAYAGTRYPMALFDTTVTIQNCGFLVRFNNLSTISPDGITPVPNGEPCESASWNFGNGDTSTNYHGQTFYNAPGTYTVTLISGIANDACSDTAVMYLTLDFPPNNPRIEGPANLCNGDSDSLLLYDAQTTDTLWLQRDGYQCLPLTPSTYALGNNQYTLSVTDPFGCTMERSHTLIVNPIFHRIDSVHLCTPLLPYSYADTTFLPGTTQEEYHLNLLSSAGCDSSYHLWLDVNDAGLDAIYDTLDISICDNQTYNFFGTSFTLPGEYTNVHVNASGLCDSIHTLLLDVRATSAVDTFANHCDNFSWHGIDYTSSTTATHLDTNAVLCDSITTLHLTMRHSTDTIIHHYVIENNLPYLWNGHSFPSDTTDFQHTLPNSQDCDSNITFNLTVYRNTQTTDSRTVCQGLLPFFWNGVVFDLSELDVTTSTITHTATLTTSHGADSVVTMHVNVLQNTSATIDDTLLQNDLASYTPPLPVPMTYNQNENDSALVQLVDTVMVIPNAAGCDSIVHYTLHIYRNYNVADSTHLCDNQLPYLWETLSLSADTMATLTLTSTHGTDSTVTFTLTVYPTFEVGDTILICPNSLYLYEGVDYGGPIDFDSPHLSVHGCDSLVHVSLQPRDSTFRLIPEVSLNQEPWLSYDTTFLGCRPSTLRFRDNSTSVSRAWDFWNADGTGDTLTGTDTLFTTFVDSLGIYSFRLIAISPEGCHDTVMNDSLLWVFSSPVAAFSYEPEYLSIHHPVANFYNLSEPDTLTYLWLFPLDEGANNCDTSREVNPSYEWEQPAEAGEYPVSLIAYLLHQGPDSLMVTCPDTVTVPIHIVNTYLQFPNLVTPNGDGINDTWVIVNLLEMGEYSMNELWIFDRWGVLVYHVKNIRRMEDFWDPNDGDNPDGTYYYRFSAKNNFGVVKRNGVIEVSR